ncbi:MAG: flavodoxin reductase [Devosia sp.]|jgi:ferredoxin-NADP reductase
MAQSVRILSAEPVTHNVRRYRLEKPPGYTFEPGQATELSIDRDGYREKKNPFTFTGYAEDDFLEFTIKSYFDHDGVTKKLWELVPGDRLILRDAWGTITYKGPGTFLAGGAGVTPFIAILRRLARDGKVAGHRLILSNKTERDIILRDEFEHMEGLDHDWIISNDRSTRLYRGRIDEDFLTHHITDFSQNFYVCGPDKMVADLRALLQKLGASAESVTFEK